MYTDSFDYFRPQTLDEALDLLRQHPGARILAGGHSLLPAMKFRLARPAALVDIGRIPGLSGVKRENGNLAIGALTTHNAIASSDLVNTDSPLLAETAAQIGDQQVRNRGTIGGSLAYADPAADFPTAVLTLEGTLQATGPKGARSIPIDQFFRGLLATNLQPDEVLTRVTIPVMPPHTGTAYLKHPHPASRYAVVGLAALVTLSQGKCEQVRLALGGVSPNPVRCEAAEASLQGQPPTDKKIRAAAELVAHAIKDPIEDTYASAEYRTHLAVVYARRALEEAVRRAAR